MPRHNDRVRARRPRRDAVRQKEQERLLELAFPLGLPATGRGIIAKAMAAQR